MFYVLSAAIWTAVTLLLNPYLIALVSIVSVIFYKWYTKKYDQWEKLGVPGPRPVFPWGTEKIPFVSPFVEVEDFLYKQANRKYCGFYEFINPLLFVADPDLIRAITIKDFDSFINRREFINNEEFKGMLQILKDKEWKETRAVMSPTFSGSKLRGMHALCIDTSTKLVSYIKKVTEEQASFEIKDTFGRFTMDNIALCAFGVNCNSFDDPNTEFATQASRLFQPPGIYGLIRIILQITFPKLGNKMPDSTKSVFEFFSRVTQETIEHRKKTGTVRKDFLQLMLDTTDKNGKRLLSDRSIVDQSVLFYIAGYDTTATMLTFAAFSLAVNQDIQRKVQEEIDICVERHGGEITYDAVMEMTYLDRVISETLRLYPPATRGEREAKFDYEIPGTKLTIPKGTVVQFPIYAIQRDEQYYPDPLTFDPDRFLPEIKETRQACTYLPFGSGPRNCIAMRFALFEAKVGLVCVLKELNLIPTKDTPKLPLEFDPKSFILTPKGRKLYLNAVQRNTNSI